MAKQSAANQTINIDDLSDLSRVGRKVVCQLYGGISHDTLERRVKAGLIPRPIKDGGHFNMWIVGELRQALNSR